MKLIYLCLFSLALMHGEIEAKAISKHPKKHHHHKSHKKAKKEGVTKPKQSLTQTSQKGQIDAQITAPKPFDNAMLLWNNNFA